jgi:hypothetical protein
MGNDLNLIAKLLVDYKKPEDIIGEHGLLKQLTKALLERAMQAEMTDHLGYAKHDQAGHNSGNSRNGKTTKVLKGDFGSCRWRRRGTATVPSSRRSSAKDRRASRASMTRLFRCMHGA